nr:valine--trna ligase, mitochondrial 1 [Quercus suber]
MGYHQWCNKLRNTVRFAMTKLGDDYVPPTNVNPNDLSFSCQWILSVLNRAIFKTIAALESYKFSDVAIKPFFARSDPRFETDKSFAQDKLWLCLDNGLRLLHPFMPYVMEKLWKCLPSSRDGTNKRGLGELLKL